MRHTTEYALIAARRRKWIIGKLLAVQSSRSSATGVMTAAIAAS
ncbi:hypothetical protein AB0K40_10090 [Nonomuraea bangladeshensis]|uniref:Uncharacterized protein n=1 Tax=Nonomuraea bangladeshensis TaxID=404385 RepID=A0ABV3GZZ0_9ACTN